MSSEQYPRDAVEPHYWKLWEQLIPACQKCSWAGSMRRRKPFVSDLEMIALPFFDTRDSLFETGETVETYNPMTAVLDRLLRDRVLVWDEQVKRRGDWYKRFRLPGLGIALDLFVAKPSNYGYIFALRTGCAEFSHALVAPRHQGGLRPDHLRCQGGHVWRQECDRNGLALTVAVDVPSEEALFDLWGMPWTRPSERDAGLAAEMRQAWGLHPVLAYAANQKGAN